jgi:hypothetical protein
MGSLTSNNPIGPHDLLRGSLIIIIIIIITIIIINYIIIALQPFLLLWSIEFLSLIHSWQSSLDGVTARCKASTYTQDNTIIE